MRMKHQKWIILSVALVLIVGTAGALTWLRANQKLGRPGIKTGAIPGSVMMKIDLPGRVLDFTSTNVPESEVELGYFPKDTSYVRRIYQAPDGFAASATIVLMGADRTSIHRPDYCLPGQDAGRAKAGSERDLCVLVCGRPRTNRGQFSTHVVAGAGLVAPGCAATLGLRFVFFHLYAGPGRRGV
jgi:hypothetical protein